MYMRLRYAFYNYTTYFRYKHENLCFVTCDVLYLKESNGNVKYHTIHADDI